MRPGSGIGGEEYYECGVLGHKGSYLILTQPADERSSKAFFTLSLVIGKAGRLGSRRHCTL